MDGLVKLVDGLNPVGDDWLAVRTHAFKILDFFQAVIGLAKELGVCTTSDIKQRQACRCRQTTRCTRCSDRHFPSGRCGCGGGWMSGLMGWLVRVCLRVVHGPSTLVKGE